MGSRGEPGSQQWRASLCHSRGEGGGGGAATDPGEAREEDGLLSVPKPLPFNPASPGNYPEEVLPQLYLMLFQNMHTMLFVAAMK